MTIEPNAVHIDNTRFPVSEISDFSIAINTFKNMAKEDFFYHFYSYTHSFFQPKRHTGISDNVIKFTVNGTSYTYQFFIQSRKHLKSLENLIIMLAFSGLLTESEAARILRQKHNYTYAEIQKFKAALISGEKIDGIDQDRIGYDVIRRVFRA